MWREDVGVRAVAAPPSLAPVSLDGDLQLIRVGEVLLVTFQGVQVFGVSGKTRKQR